MVARTEGRGRVAWETPFLSRVLRYPLHLGVLRRSIIHREGYLDDRREDHPGARSYETEPDVKWICKMLQRMEAQGEDFESRLRALEGWRAEKAGEERKISTLGAGAGGIVGGIVAVLLRMMGGG